MSDWTETTVCCLCGRSIYTPGHRWSDYRRVGRPTRAGYFACRRCMARVAAELEAGTIKRCPSCRRHPNECMLTDCSEADGRRRAIYPDYPYEPEST